MDWFHRLEDVMTSFLILSAIWPLHFYWIFHIGRRYFPDWSDNNYLLVATGVLILAYAPNIFITYKITGFIEDIFARININYGRKTMRELLEEHNKKDDW